VAAAPRPVVPVLAGPTAVGKSARALAWARATGGEIVSADSRQVYRGLDVGTAKPTPEELAEVPHHFVDELDLHEPFSAGAFARAAETRIRDILARGRPPIVVGGSTLYLHALVYGLADVPPTDPATRQRLTARLHAEGSDVLFAELRGVDPVSAASMDPTKTQRVVRALEVYHDTGHPLSAYHAEVVPPFDTRVILLSRPRAELYARIDHRVDAMLAAGLLDEARALREAGHRPDLNPLRTIGYQEPLAHLRGEVPYDEMVRVLKRNSRRYAKRQITWFRRFLGMQ